MSIPPIKRNSPEIQLSHPESKIEGTQAKDIDMFQKAESAISKAIDHSIWSRKDRLKILSQSMSDQFKNLEKNLTKLRIFSLEICRLLTESKKLGDELDSLSSDDEDKSIAQQRKNLDAKIQELEDPIDEAEQKLKNFTKIILDENPELGFTKELFSEWQKLDRIEEFKRELSMRFMEEQLLNRYLNQICFLNDIQIAVEEKKKEILEAFYQGDSHKLDVERITFKLFPQGNETHNRGKIPVKVIFNLGQVELFSVFLKPRNAHVDQKVLELFHELNELPQEKKSSGVILPTYTIINMEHKNAHFSIWEFINGKHLDGTSASEAIENLQNTEEKNRLYAQLLRLESICKFIEISDLHLDNLIFMHLGKANVQVVPIDLESIQPGNVTGLFSKAPEIPPLTADEKMLLEKFNQAIGEIPFRFVPIPTSHFLGGLTRCDSFISMANFINQSIQRKNYRLSIQQSELEWLVLNDFIHNDVPYLTEYKSHIYYGVPKEDNGIARRLE